MPLGLEPEALTYLLEGRLYLQRITNQGMICSGSAARLVHSKAWVSNSPHGSRTSIQRRGTAGNPVLCQTAVSETTSTARFSPPYQSATVIGVQAVFGSWTITERFGKHSPLSRGRPI